jgi:hypothetical protein
MLVPYTNLCVRTVHVHLFALMSVDIVQSLSAITFEILLERSL